MLNLPRPSGCSSGGGSDAAEESFSSRAWWLIGHVPLDLLIPLMDPVPVGWPGLRQLPLQLLSGQPAGDGIPRVQGISALNFTPCVTVEFPGCAEI